MAITPGTRRGAYEICLRRGERPSRTNPFDSTWTFAPVLRCLSLSSSGADKPMFFGRRRLRATSGERYRPLLSRDSATRALAPRARNGATRSWSAATSGGSTLMATWRLKRLSCARYASPVPPLPIRSAESETAKLVPCGEASRRPNFEEGSCPMRREIASANAQIE